MLEEIGVHTGLDPAAVTKAAHEIGARLGLEVKSHRGTGCTRAEIMRLAAESPKNPHAMT
jgi:hypothetical protein